MGRRDATTGRRIAAYSNALVESEKSVNAERRGGAGPTTAGARAPPGPANRIPARDPRAGEPGRRRFLGAQQPVSNPSGAAVEAASKELGHRLVEVEDDRDARQPDGQCREDQDVGKGMHLDEAVAPPAMGSSKGE